MLIEEGSINPEYTQEDGHQGDNSQTKMLWTPPLEGLEDESQEVKK